MFGFEAVLMWAYGKVRSDYGMDCGFEDFSQWREESDGPVGGMEVGIFVGFQDGDYFGRFPSGGDDVGVYYFIEKVCND